MSHTLASMNEIREIKNFVYDSIVDSHHLQGGEFEGLAQQIVQDLMDNNFLVLRTWIVQAMEQASNEGIIQSCPVSRQKIVDRIFGEE